MKKALTYTLMTLSVIWTVWVLRSGAKDEGWRRFGISDGFEVFSGDYWTLLTSMFVHVNWMHLFFNVYWLNILGCYTEVRYGRGFYAAFVVTCGFVTAMLELSFGGQTGVGLSGVLYGIFGFLWGTTLFQKEEHEFLSKETVKMFLGWLVLCIVLTLAKVMSIANVAHLSGLLYGLLVARTRSFRPGAARSWRMAVPLICLGLLFYSPWSYPWLASRAYKAHQIMRFTLAESYYTKILALRPEDKWALLNRAKVLKALGRLEEAQKDLSRADHAH